MFGANVVYYANHKSTGDKLTVHLLVCLLVGQCKITQSHTQDVRVHIVIGFGLLLAELPVKALANFIKVFAYPSNLDNI